MSSCCLKASPNPVSKFSVTDFKSTKNQGLISAGPWRNLQILAISTLLNSPVCAYRSLMACTDLIISSCIYMGFPCGSAQERICLQCWRPGFDPWLGKIPWRRESLLTPVFWPGEFHGLCSLQGRKESDTTEQTSFIHSCIYTFKPRFLKWMESSFFCPS